MIREAIIKLSKKEDLTYQEAYECMNEIMDDQASDIQKAAYLTALYKHISVGRRLYIAS